jgi:hypothetical protein
VRKNKLGWLLDIWDFVCGVADIFYINFVLGYSWFKIRA